MLPYGHAKFGIGCGSKATFTIQGRFRPFDGLDRVEIKLNGTIVYEYESSLADGEEYFRYFYDRDPAPSLPGDPLYPKDPDDTYTYWKSAMFEITPMPERPCGNIIEIRGDALPGPSGVGDYPGDIDIGLPELVPLFSEPILPWILELY